MRMASNRADKSPVTDYAWFVLPLRKSIDFLLLTFWEYSVYVKKNFIASLAKFHPKT